MKARVAALALMSLVIAAPIPAKAQQQQIPRIGVLAAAGPGPYYDALRKGLRDLGYVEGQHLTLEWRRAEGNQKRLPGLAAELARLKVDVIVAPSNPSIAAAQKATTTIPIVMVIPTDPVGLGFVTSLARPGGNTTGLSIQGDDLDPKRLQHLKEAVPNLSTVAILWDPTEAGRRAGMRSIEAAAQTLGLQVRLVEARGPADLENAVEAMKRVGAKALIVGASSMVFVHRARLLESATRKGLPTLCGSVEWVKAGCLVSYSASFDDMFYRAAGYVDKILKGAKPADLPIEQPTKFELVINMKTAKALGLAIPPSLLLRADQVIE